MPLSWSRFLRTLEVAEKVWSEVFFYLAENNVMFEGILLKPGTRHGNSRRRRLLQRQLRNIHSLCLREECLLRFQESCFCLEDSLKWKLH
ncbi:hypothetical protein ACET3Z_027631 [Daucus carota]